MNEKDRNEMLYELGNLRGIAIGFLRENATEDDTDEFEASIDRLKVMLLNLE